MTDITWTNVTASLADLQPWEHNPKTSTKKQAGQLARSFDELGQFQTIAIGPAGEVYDGHQRLTALLAAHGPGYQVEARQASRPLTEQERRKIAIYSRQIGAWDWDILSGWQPQELTAWGFDVDLLTDWRRDVAALGDFLGGEDKPPEAGDAEPQIDRAEELREKWGVELGQMWRLPSRVDGQEHRLICGDCTDGDVVARVMGGEKADMYLTDPPYGVEYEGIENDDYAGLTALLGGAFSCADFSLRNGAAYYICHPDVHSYEFSHEIRAVKWKQARPPVVLWLKDVPVMGQGDYNSQTEPIFYGWKGSGHYFAGEIWTNVWPFARPKVSGIHTTEKPVGLFENALKNSSKRGWLILEPFSGSGTTIIAAENLARQCRAVEISPAYVAVTLQRYLDAFGITPELITNK